MTRPGQAVGVGPTIHIDCITLHPTEGAIPALRLAVASIGAYGSRMVEAVERTFIMSTWGQHWEVSETVADIDAKLTVVP